MKTEPDHDSLLADVLAEAGSNSSRGRLLEETLGLVRRRRRVRLALRTMVPLLILGLGVFSARWIALRTRLDTAPSIARCPIVHTQSLPVSAIVTTRRFDRLCWVATTGFAGTVRTVPGLNGVRLINDTELLALVGPRPAILVRVGPKDEELIFLE